MTTETKPDAFADVPDLSDVAEANDRTRGPSLRESCLEIAQLLRRKAEAGDRGVKAVNAETVQVAIEAYFELVMRETIRTGRMRLPSGWGSFHLQHIKGSKTPRTVPGVGEVPRIPSVRVKFVGGVAVEQLLQRSGNTTYLSKRTRERDYHFPELETPSEKDLTE
jgi:hypothetical protein